MPIRYLISRLPVAAQDGLGSRFLVTPMCVLPSWEFELPAPDAWDEVEIVSQADMTRPCPMEESSTAPPAADLSDAPLSYTLEDDLGARSLRS